MIPTFWRFEFTLNTPPPGGHFWDLSGGGYLAWIQIFKKSVSKFFAADFFYSTISDKDECFFNHRLEVPFFLVNFRDTLSKVDGNYNSPPPENDTKLSLFPSWFSFKKPHFFRFNNSFWSSIKFTENIKCIPHLMSMLFFKENKKGTLIFSKRRNLKI